MSSARRSSSAVRNSPSISSKQGPGLSISDLLAAPPSPADLPPSSNWQEVPASELMKNQRVFWIDPEMPVEKACQILVDCDLLCLLIRAAPGKAKVSRVFDYSDIIAFLLIVLGYGGPDTQDFSDLVKTARQGGQIPVSLVSDLGSKDPFLTFSETTTLGELSEVLGTGVRRVAITRKDSEDVIGIFSQQRLVKYLWDHARAFPATEALYAMTIRDIDVGSSTVVSISGDRRVLDAFEMMNASGISSLAIVDAQGYLLGNISAVDVRYVTRSSSAHLLHTNCAHYLSVIKYEQGLRDGKDSAPHFNISSSSTLAYTVAKMVATRSHRLWLVSSPPSSGGSLPVMQSPSMANVPSSAHQSPSSTPATNSPSSGHAAIPGSVSVGSGTQGGILQGVVSLTDIIGVFVRSIGIKVDPREAREFRRRRTSSASSSATSERPHIERPTRR